MDNAISDGRKQGRCNHNCDRSPDAERSATIASDGSRAMRLADSRRRSNERRTDMGEQSSAPRSACGEARQRQRSWTDGCSCGDGLRLADSYCERRNGVAVLQEQCEEVSESPWSGCVDRMADRRWSSPIEGGWSDPDWLLCRDAKWRPVRSGTFPLADRVPARVGRLRGYGNAIVPQVAATFLKALVGSL